MRAPRFLRLAAIAAGIAALLRLYVFESISIASASMEPTLPVGSVAVLDKVTYRFRTPRRGDIVIFRSPVAPEEEMGKRIVALEGDIVEIKGKRLVLNGRLAAEPYTLHARVLERLVGDDFGPVRVPAGHAFVLGDNRDRSEDSSVWKDPRTGEARPFLPLGNVRGLVRPLHKRT